VIDVFKKDWVMWWLLVWYGLSIFFGLFVLEAIGGEYQNLGHWEFSLESCVFLAYSMGIAAFAGLFFHIGNVIDLLKPEKIIEKLSEDITKEKILEFIESDEKQKENRTQPVEDDPVQPIVDIIHSSVMKFDIATTRNGLNAITDKAIKIIGLKLFSMSVEFEEDLNNYTFSEGLKNMFKTKGFPLSENVSITKEDCEHEVWRIMDKERTCVVMKEDGKLNIYDLNNEIDISKHFCDHLGRAGKYAASVGDDESTIETIHRLEEIGKPTTEVRHDKIAGIAAQYIETIGTYAAEKKLISATVATVKSLEAVGTFAAKKRLRDATSQAIGSLENVGMHTSENKLKIATQFAAEFLGNVGKCAAENKLKDATKQAADSLGVIGEYAAENKLKDATKQAADSLGVIGTIAAEKGGELEDAAIQAVESLRVVGKIAERNELEKAVWQAAESLGRVGKTAAKSGLRRVAEDAVGNLVFFGKFEIKKGNEGKTKQVIWLLHEIGRIAAEKGKELEDVTSQAALSLGDVGRIAAEKGKELEDAISQVAQSLIDIGIVAEENGLEDAPLQAAWSLAELTISSEGIVKTEIQKLEIGIKQEYRESFDKFKKLYEQRLKVEHELEELRTRKPD
jgi:hypothetical protein